MLQGAQLSEFPRLKDEPLSLTSREVPTAPETSKLPVPALRDGSDEAGSSPPRCAYWSLSLSFPSLTHYRLDLVSVENWALLSLRAE